jgi:hypothetical protein
MSSNTDAEMMAPAPEHCPGTESEQAGKADACQGCPNQQICATAPKGPDPGAQLMSRSSAGSKPRAAIFDAQN